MGYDKVSLLFPWLLAFFASCAMSPATAAREPLRGETVLSRPRPEVDPIGYPLGGIRAYGQLAYTGVFDSNVFATPVDTSSDYISVISARAALRSDWTKHALNVEIDADIGRYVEFSKQDFDDWRVAGDGRLDVSPNTQIIAGGEFAKRHQPRSSPDDTGGLESTKYTSASAFVRYRQRLGRSSFAPQFSLEELNFEDVPAIRNGMPVSIDQDFRDRTEYTIGLRGDYEIIPESNELFLRLRGIARDYHQLQRFPLGPFPGFPSEINRSSYGYEVDAGLAFDLGGIIFGEFFAGYREQRYKDPLPDVETVTFGGSIDWNITSLTTINFDVERDVNETTQAFYSGYVSTVGRLTINHELRRNLLLNATFSIGDNDYEGISTPIGDAKREDTVYTAGVDAKYLLNRHLYASLGYAYLRRDSNDNTLLLGSPNRDYKIHLVFFRLETQY